jgi:aspartate 1-decarboxylase
VIIIADFLELEDAEARVWRPRVAAVDAANRLIG